MEIPVNKAINTADWPIVFKIKPSVHSVDIEGYRQRANDKVGGPIPGICSPSKRQWPGRQSTIETRIPTTKWAVLAITQANLPNFAGPGQSPSQALAAAAAG